MANQIIDNRILITDADGNATSFATNQGGGADDETDIVIEGTGSVGIQGTNTLRYLQYNIGTTQDFTNTVLYIWVNCSVVGLLNSQAAGGFTIRFSGPTVTNFFEVYIGGNDNWPIAIQGGWVQFVVDIDLAEANPSNTGGTPPAITAIQHIGIAVQTSAMTKGVANSFIDAMWYLNKGTAGILVEGVKTAGSPVTPWEFVDIATQLTTESGMVKLGTAGSFIVNAPIQIGVLGSPATVNSFLDTNSIILWDSQEFIDNDLYLISAKGTATNDTYVVFGAKSGTGTSASGSQGGVIAAASGATRWNMDFTDTDLTSVGLYGVSMIHSGDLQLDNPVLEAISTLYIDGVKATVSDSLQLKISVINPNVGGSPQVGSPINVGYMYTNDMSNISFSSLQFSQGHGIVITTQTGSPPVAGSPLVPTTQSSLNNSYSGYGPDNTASAAVYNITGKTITLNSSGDTGLTVRTTANTIVVADPVTTTITVLDADTQQPVKDARVWVNDTGSPITTYLFGVGGTLTDVNGQVSDTRSLGADLPIAGRVRRATRTLGSPLNEKFYKTGIVSGTIDSATGFSTTVFLIPDE